MPKRNNNFTNQSFEFAVSSLGLKLVAGTDEAGRGPLAGPVVAAAVILEKKFAALGINDSKKLSPAQRESLYGEIIFHSKSWCVSIIDENEIDRINILRASLEAMKRAVLGLSEQPDFVFVDGPKKIDISIPQAAIIRGDAVCCSIAAASIIAKVTRDKIMLEFDRQYPDYGFARHKGYGTKEHLEALNKSGPCPIHRKTFGPVKRLFCS